MYTSSGILAFIFYQTLTILSTFFVRYIQPLIFRVFGVTRKLFRSRLIAFPCGRPPEN